MPHRPSSPAPRPPTSQTTTTTRPDHATRADDATQADRATRVDHAIHADHVTRADRVTHADRLTRGERGAVTAEMALALPVLVSLLLLGIWSIGLVVQNIRCIDAARDVARAVARGESLDQAKAIGRRTVPAGTIVITRDASDIQVTVTAIPTHRPPLLTFLSPPSLKATATLQAEPDTP